MTLHKTHRRAAVVAAAVAAAAGVAVIALAASPSTSPSSSATMTTAANATSRPTAAVSGHGRSSHHSRSSPTATPLPEVAVSTATQPMATAFSAVRYRSIFVRGDQSIGSTGTRIRDYPTSLPPPPQASLVFNGVTFVGDRADAMIEDTNAHKVFTVRVGELLAGGRVQAITFDNLDYLNGGKLVRVALGQTLEGMSPSSLPDAAPVAGGGPAPADAAGTLGNTVNMSPEDILAKMKKRRQQEMGGGK